MEDSKSKSDVSTAANDAPLEEISTFVLLFCTRYHCIFQMTTLRMGFLCIFHFQVEEWSLWTQCHDSAAQTTHCGLGENWWHQRPSQWNYQRCKHITRPFRKCATKISECRSSDRRTACRAATHHQTTRFAGDTVKYSEIQHSCFDHEVDMNSFHPCYRVNILLWKIFWFFVFDFIQMAQHGQEMNSLQDQLSAAADKLKTSTSSVDKVLK